MPVYGLGTWLMGGQNERNPKNNDSADIAAIQAALKLGVTHIDTAENYANGYTEALVGQAIKKYNRRSLFLTTKVRATHMAYEDTLHAAKESLLRLGTDYLDLYLLHRYYPDIPLSETLGALDELVKQGLVRNIGVCNFPAEKLKEAQILTRNKIVCNQVHFNLKFREAEQEGVLKYCRDHDIMLVAWRPIQMGMILDRNIPIIKEMMDKYQKTPAQIALNWLISQPNVAVIAKTSNTAHLQENLGAMGWSMKADDIEKLRKEYPNQVAVSDAVPLHQPK